MRRGWRGVRSQWGCKWGRGALCRVRSQLVARGVVVVLIAVENGELDIFLKIVLTWFASDDRNE